MTDPHPVHAGEPTGNGARYRQLVLALAAATALGLVAELWLLGHYEDPWQWAPLVALGATLLALGIVAVRPGRGAIRLLQGISIACVLLGAIGVWLHLNSNIEFETERAPTLRGWALYWEALRGAIPALAPGALAQLGVLGLLYGYRHPAAITPRGSSDPSHQESA